MELGNIAVRLAEILSNCEFARRIGVSYTRPNLYVEKTIWKKQEAFKKQLLDLKKVVETEDTNLLFEDDSAICDY